MKTNWFITRPCITLLLFAQISLLASATTAPTTLWFDLLDEPGTNIGGDSTYLNSLPIGNGEVTALVTIETEADVTKTSHFKILIESQSAWNEAAEPYKTAFIKISPTTQNLNKMTKSKFTQMSLDMNTATVNVQFGKDLNFDFYVDAVTNLIVINGSIPMTYEIERLRGMPTVGIPFGDCFNYTISNDFYSDDGTMFAHRNVEEVKEATMRERTSFYAVTMFICER